MEKGEGVIIWKNRRLNEFEEDYDDSYDDDMPKISVFELPAPSVPFTLKEMMTRLRRL